MNLTVYNNGDVILKEKITNFNYNKGKYLKFNDGYGKHKLDIDKQIYEKIADNVIFRIDFVNNLCIIILDSDKRYEFAIETNWNYQKNIWTLNYKLEEENKQIIIELEE